MTRRFAILFGFRVKQARNGTWLHRLCDDAISFPAFSLCTSQRSAGRLDLKRAPSHTPILDPNNLQFVHAPLLLTSLGTLKLSNVSEGNLKNLGKGPRSRDVTLCLNKLTLESKEVPGRGGPYPRGCGGGRDMTRPLHLAFVAPLPLKAHVRFWHRPRTARHPAWRLLATASSTWRSPRHLQRTAPPGGDASWARLAALGARAATVALKRTRKRALLTKVVSAAVAVASAGMVSVGYVRLNESVNEVASSAAESILGRSAAVGRMKRVSLPARVHFAGAELGEGVETAPDVAVKGELVVGVSQFGRAVWERKPLIVDVSLVRPLLKVRQLVKNGPVGPVGKWDAALPVLELRDGEDGADDEDEVERDIVVEEDDEEEKWKRERRPLREGSIPIAFTPNAGIEPSATGSWKLDRFPLQFALGRIALLKSNITFLPAKIPGVYTHGADAVEIGDASAELTVVHEVSEGNGTLAQVSARGFPEGGGKVEVSSSIDFAALEKLLPGDPLLSMRIKGSGVQSRRVASFLNLPFRSDHGFCDADLEVRFRHEVDEMVPEMFGTAKMDGVSMRFHPDPTAPELTGIGGSLRFDDKTVFLDGPNGVLGSLPMTVVGSIDLVGDYNLVGYVRSTDVNNVIDTFDVDKFSPVAGRVKGEARMTGPIEGPVVQGWVASTGSCVFDRVPLDHVNLEYSWDAVAGVLKFGDISANITGGGAVTGRGGLYFDMTKITPYDILTPTEHHPNNPKASVASSDELPPLPKDEMEIDPHAPSRPYDSMRFDFAVRDVPGGNVLSWYGGPQGSLAAASIGIVEGDAVLAGHAKDANCRALWRSVSAPPTVLLADEPPPESDGGAVEDGAARINVFVRNRMGMISEAQSVLKSFALAKKVEVSDRTTVGKFPGSDRLGGGNFQGAIFLKMGDLPAARRVRMRTTIHGFDLRRLAWGDTEKRDYLANCPSLVFSADSYYKGVLQQRLLPVFEGSNENPRTPQAELVGIDGAIAVRELRLNNFRFRSNLTGSLRTNMKDLNLILEERRTSAVDEKVATATRDLDSTASREGNRSSNSPKLNEEKSPTTDPQESLQNHSPPRHRFDHEQRASRSGRKASAETQDELRVSVSETGESFLSIRRDRAEVVFSVRSDDLNNRILSLFAREVGMDDIFGGNGLGTNGIPTASLDADCVLNLSESRGTGGLALRRPRYAGLALDNFTGNAVWRGEKVILENSVARFRQSEYHLSGTYRLPLVDGSRKASWDMTAVIPKASVQELTRILEIQRQRRRRNRAMSFPHAPVSTVGSNVFSTAESKERASLSRAAASTRFESPVGAEYSWSMPKLPLDRQIAWFRAFKEAERERAKRAKVVGAAAKSAAQEKLLLSSGPSLMDVRGSLCGSFVARYDGNAGDPLSASTPSSSDVAETKKGLLSRAFIEPMQKVSFEFEVRGQDWKVGPHAVEKVSASGKLSGSGLEFTSTVLNGRTGFEASAKGFVASNGEVDGHAFVKEASASSLSQYVRGKFRLAGHISCRVDVGGSIANPLIQGKTVWRDATLNGQNVRNARSDLHCEDGRCALHVHGRYGGRARSDKKDDDFNVHQQLRLTQVAPESELKDAKVVAKTANQPKETGEPLELSVSAPVRFYALEYLRKVTSPDVWAELEPLFVATTVGSENWISVDVNVRRYGLLLLGVALPDLGWLDGSSNINLRVRGTVDEPVITGFCSVSDGKLWPSVLTKPVENVRGEVVFEEGGAVYVRSIIGRYNGRPLSINGSLPLSKKHLEATRKAASAADTKQRPSTRAIRKASAEKRSFAASRLERFSRGITVDIGEVLIDIKDQFYGTIAGRITATESLAAPSISGSLSISSGVIYLATPPVSPESALSAMPAFFAQGKPELKGARDSTGRRSDATKRPDASGVAKSAPTALRPSAKRKSTSSATKAASPVRLNGLRLVLGREIEIVYPYLLKFVASGTVTLDGSTTEPVPTGTVNFTEGEVNMLTSKMYVKRDVENFARFSAGDNVLDPILNLTLEDRHIQLQVKDARASTWSNFVTISNKRGERIDESVWIEHVRLRLAEVEKCLASGRGIPSLAVKYLVNSFSIKKKIGPALWRVYPALVSGMGGFQEPRILEDIGLGADFEYKGAVVSARRSVRGNFIGALSLFPSDRIRIELESDGQKTSSEIEIRVSSNRPSRGEEDAVLQEESRVVIEPEKPKLSRLVEDNPSPSEEENELHSSDDDEASSAGEGADQSLEAQLDSVEPRASEDKVDP
jgi:TamB, inner membrane protein subunit of TAM complex